jgi:nucleoside-diphosphate-sugar epimerase
LESKGTGKMPRTGNILVTGATGFIGRNLVRRLEALGHKVYPFSRSTGHDVIDKNSFTPLLEKEIGVVVHLAGLTFVPDSWIAAGSFYAVNTLGTQQVLEFCRSTQARMVYVSAYVYGLPKYLPIDENHPLVPNNPYAHSKWLGEELCRFYAENMGVKSIILRPFNLYGPGQDDRFLIPTLLRQIRETGEITVKDELPKRDYLHINDFVEACCLAMTHDETFSIFNVGSGTSHSVYQIIEMLRRGFRADIPFTSLNEKRQNEIPDTVADISAIRRSVGWSPKTTLNDAIIRMSHCDRTKDSTYWQGTTP